jgi:hypothetical protein
MLLPLTGGCPDEFNDSGVMATWSIINPGCTPAFADMTDGLLDGRGCPREGTAADCPLLEGGDSGEMAMWGNPPGWMPAFAGMTDRVSEGRGSSPHDR